MAQRRTSDRVRSSRPGSKHLGDAILVMEFEGKRRIALFEAMTHSTTRPHNPRVSALVEKSFRARPASSNCRPGFERTFISHGVRMSSLKALQSVKAKRDSPREGQFLAD